MPYKLNIIIEEDEDGFYAYCPELKGCQSQGDSLEEVKENIQEAVELYLETLSENEKQELLQKKSNYYDFRGVCCLNYPDSQLKKQKNYYSMQVFHRLEVKEAIGYIVKTKLELLFLFTRAKYYTQK